MVKSIKSMKIDKEKYKDWFKLKDKPIVNKGQLFEWMNHLNNDEIKEWESKVKGNKLTAMIEMHVLYESSKLEDDD